MIKFAAALNKKYALRHTRVCQLRFYVIHMSALKVDTEIQLALNDASLTLRVYRMA